MEVFVALLIFIAIILIAALVFGGWMIVAVVRLIGRAIGGAGANEYAARRPPALPNLARCDNAGCLMENPRRARFCRRCGRELGAERVRSVRRVAMF